MALDQNDKKWMQETFATKTDLEKFSTKEDLQFLEKRTSAQFTEIKEMFKIQNEAFSRALTNQTDVILKSVASRERVEKLESQMADMEDRIEALEKTQKQTVAV